VDGIQVARASSIGLVDHRVGLGELARRSNVEESILGLGGKTVNDIGDEAICGRLESEQVHDYPSRVG
jgi:hypothetical protein